MTFIRSLKGAPASVLWALLFTRRPMTNRELRDWTGYSDKSVTRAARELIDKGWLTAYSHTGPWSIAAGRLLAWISASGFSGVLQGSSASPAAALGILDAPAGICDVQAGNSGGTDGISAPSSSSSGSLTESTSSKEELLLEAAPAEFPASQTDFEKNLQALFDSGIREPAARMLASLPHVTPAYVRDHVEQVREEGQPLGLAIYRMRRGWFAPSRKKKGWDPEAVNEKIRRFVEGGD